MLPLQWVERDERRAAADRLPTTHEQRQRLAETAGAGADGLRLLAAIYAADAPGWLREVPAGDVLRQVWVQNFVPIASAPGEQGEQGEQRLRWRTEEDGLPPAALFIASLSDLGAHYARKYTISWVGVGYKVHLTETCEDDTPHLTSPMSQPPPLLWPTATRLLRCITRSKQKTCCPPSIW